MSFTEKEKEKVIKRYSDKYDIFGYSEKTLGWDKGKQKIRFDVLTSTWDFKNKSVLDIGCGFGDLYDFLNNKFDTILEYRGLDIVAKLVEKGNKVYANNSNFNLEVADFLEWESDKKYDYIIISGIFNFKLEKNNIKFIEDVLEKAFKLANIGVACNFLSNRVEYKLEHAYHTNPLDALEIGYGLSRNIVLKNDYFPFEFSLFINKNDTFFKHNTIFKSYESKYE